MLALLALVASAAAASAQAPSAPAGAPDPSGQTAEPGAAAAAATPPALARRMNLDEAIDAALADNFGLRLARNDLASGQSSVRAAENAFDFKLATSINEQHAYQRNAEIAVPPGVLVRDALDEDQLLTFSLGKDLRIGGSVELRSDLMRYRLPGYDPVHEATTSAAWTIPLWGGRGKRVTTAGLVGAQTALRQQSRGLVEREMTVVVQVVRAFYQVLRSESVLKIDQDAVARARANDATLRLRLEEGLVTPIDVKRAQRELKDRENVVVTDVESLQAARDQLLQLLALPLETPLELDGQPVFERVEADLAPATEEALANRADLRAQREAVDLALLDVEVARSSARPRLDLTLSAGFTSVSGDEASDWLKVDDDDIWTGGLGLSYTFGERADDEALVRALVSADTSKVRLVELERQVVLEVRDSVRNVRSLERQVALLEENVQLAQESLRLAQLQLAESLIDTTDMLQIQDEVVRAETALVNALYDHAAARVSLDLALGRYRVAGEAPRRSPFLQDEPPVQPDVPVLPRVRLAPAGVSQ